MRRTWKSFVLKEGKNLRGKEVCHNRYGILGEKFREKCKSAIPKISVFGKIARWPTRNARFLPRARLEGLQSRANILSCLIFSGRASNCGSYMSSMSKATRLGCEILVRDCFRRSYSSHVNGCQMLDR